MRMRLTYPDQGISQSLSSCMQIVCFYTELESDKHLDSSLITITRSEDTPNSHKTLNLGLFNIGQAS